MKQGRPSATAEANAAFRAVETSRPTDERVCNDPFAMGFLGLKFATIVRSRLLTRIALWYAERIVPGAPNGVVVRTRYIDDYLKARMDDGIEQLVILGAGYDSRAYRFDERERQIRVFEVDHPDTQRVKIEKVKKMFGSLPGNVVYVPLDLDEMNLATALIASGHDENKRTLFIWEGVTVYLTPEAVDETLAFVAGHSGRGSSIIFDYAFKSVLDGAYESEEAKRWREAYERRGEPPKFGIEQEAVEEFLLRRGFREVKNVTMESLEQEYFQGANRGRKVTHLGGVVSAVVLS
jgi:methyltransferase (TIGR00027 family)